MKKIFISLLLIIASMHAQGKELEKFIEGYLDDFANGKIIDQYFVDSPHFIFGPHLVSPKSRSEAVEIVADIRSKLEKSGYVRSKVLKFKTKAEIDNYSLFTVQLRRYKKNELILDEVCSTYGVIKSEGGLKIISWQPSKVPDSEVCE
jgi:hypothetical protein